MTPAQSIINDAQVELQDPTGVRWPATELVTYLHAGQTAIVVKRPDQNAVTEAFAPVAGARQTLPSSALALIDVPRNSGGRARAITKVDYNMLDAVNRDWRGMPGVTEFVHFCHDMREPRAFLLYPPALPGAASVEITYGAAPAQTPAASGPSASTVTGNIDLPDQWADALRHYILFRAYSKDAEFGGNAALAKSHYDLFRAELGEQLQSSATVAPTS